MPLLEIKNLQVEFSARGKIFPALRGISLSLEAGERLGIVGESGAGKSLAAFAVLNLVPPPGRISGGEILFDGRNLLRLSPSELRAIRGDRIAMIFQDPMTTLNPVMTVGEQMTETLKAHRRISNAEAQRLAVAKLREVAIPSPQSRFDSYPHELSGGMRQRVVIAIALLADPSLIIADEPTTALDVTIQAEIMALLAHLCEARGASLILITHDLGLVSQATDRAAVMYAGKIAEVGKTEELINRPRHPYTKGLLDALPKPNPDSANRRFRQIPGTMPSLAQMPNGCAFHPRCEFADDICRRGESPPSREIANRIVACHFADNIPQ